MRGDVVEGFFFSAGFAWDLRASPSDFICAAWEAVSSPSVSTSGGESSRVEIVECEDSMSEWRRVNLSLVMSSVKGARKATFFETGNIGLDWAKVRRWLLLRGRGLLLRMDVTL